MIQKSGLFLVTFLFAAFLLAQDMSPETRERFIKDQDEYLLSLNLNLDQRRDYQVITIKYEKQNMAAQRAGLTGGALKSKMKSIRKAKDVEMKQILNKYQFKLYLKRQKEIDNNYE